MTICLCHGGICELCIRCSWPFVIPVTLTEKQRKYQALEVPKKNFLSVTLELLQF